MVQPVPASQASPPVAAACTSSASMPPHTGYSVVSQPNSVSSTARPRVIHWYRWWWVLTKPGVIEAPGGVDRRTRRPSTCRRRRPGPTAVITSSGRRRRGRRRYSAAGRRPRSTTCAPSSTTTVTSFGPIAASQASTVSSRVSAISRSWVTTSARSVLGGVVQAGGAARRGSPAGRAAGRPDQEDPVETASRTRRCRPGSASARRVGVADGGLFALPRTRRRGPAPACSPIRGCRASAASISASVKLVAASPGRDAARTAQPIVGPALRNVVDPPRDVQAGPQCRAGLGLGQLVEAPQPGGGVLVDLLLAARDTVRGSLQAGRPGAEDRAGVGDQVVEAVVGDLGHLDERGRVLLGRARSACAPSPTRGSGRASRRPAPRRSAGCRTARGRPAVSSRELLVVLVVQHGQPDGDLVAFATPRRGYSPSTASLPRSG